MSLPTQRRSSLLRRKEPIQNANDSFAPERATPGQTVGQLVPGSAGYGTRDNIGGSAVRRGSEDQGVKDSLSSPSTARSSKIQGSTAMFLDSPYSSRLPTPLAASPRSSQFSSTFVTPHDSPSSASTSPRQYNPSTTSTSRNPPVSLSSSQVGSQARRSSTSSRSNSLRRKPPPPLDFSPDDSPRSQTQIDRSDDSPKRWTSSQGKSIVPETPNREEEQRDTVSNMVDFRPSPAQSPVLNTSIPSSTLDLSRDNDDRDDDTIGSGISYLSSSTSSSNNLEADDQPRPYQPSNFLGSSTSSYEQAYLTRPYQGVGLGLPFSVSAAANLSSFANSGSRSSSQPHPIDIPSPSATTRDPYRSPRPEDRNGGSPVVDRNQLIGLGELATPRWTSAALERRWGQSTEDGNTDVFDVHDPMPSTRHLNESTGSPVASRQFSQSLHDPSFANRPFGNSTSSSLQPASLLPHSASTSSISTNVSPAGLINFGQDSASTFGNLEYTPSSPVYSLDATSSDDVLAPQHPESVKQDTADTYNSFPAPPTPQNESQPSRRKSVGAASSAPPTTGTSVSNWGMRPGKDMVGLGFDYDGTVGGGESASTSGTDDATSYSRRRLSQGSINSSAATKRSSNRSSTDGKAALRHRRQSASKSSFAHLPPSPAAATASHNLASSTASAPVSSAPPPPPPPQMQPSSSSQSTPSARTPDHSRLSRHSFHSHHSSPSLVAASILRHTRDLEGVDLDIEKAAAVDEGTAEELRKLDGLSSPKMSRIASNPTTTNGGGEPRSRKSSRGPIEMPMNVRRESEERVRRRTRSSLGDGGDSVGGDRAPLASGSALPSPSLSSLPYSQSSVPKSPLVGSTSSGRPQPQRIPSSSNYEVPFPSSGSPFKRGSSSSASYTVATSTSASGSHDSTSGTSFASRSVASKARRSSAGSDISSTNSGIEGRPGVERSDSNGGEGDQARGIPPVPPLPKDWEAYRPTASSNPPLSASTATTASSSISFPSPRPENEVRRPSFASSLENSFRSSPRAPQLEPTISKDSGKDTSSTGRRKWSISSAFHKASKSPKTGGGIKESSSFSDLQAPSQRERKSSFGSRLGDGTQLPKRMASSTNDIASLAGTRSDYSSSTTGSLGRNSIRSDKASMIARARTSSQSSTSTARTMNQQTSNPLPTPSIVTTSPGRSRSSLINPRRTPSGIPFFSRKSSNSNEPSTTNATPSPNSEKTGEERNGRKSILGLNFLRSGGSKRDKEKATRSPPSSSKRPTFSTSTSSSTLDSDAGVTDEFGRRASKTSDLLTRKRGKTLSSVDAKNEDVFGGKSQATQLPPFQMPALSSTTNRRVDALNTSQASTASSTYSKAPPSPAGSVLSTPRTRTSKLQESMRANLPTIAGSPSTHASRQSANGAGDARTASQDPSPSGTPPPKSHTPTKIPRLGRIGVTASPKPLATGRSRDPSPAGSSITTKSSFRRSSSFGGPGDISNPLAATFSSSVAPSTLQNESTDEFGSVNREPGLQLGEKTLSTRRRLDSDATLSSGIPRSRSTTTASLSSTSRDPLTSSTPSSRQSTALPRAARRPSVVEEERKPAPASSTINSTPARSNQPRLSSLSASAPRLSSQIASDSTSASSSATTTLPPSSSSKRIPLKPTETNTFPRRTSLASATDTLSSSKSTRSLASKGAIPTRVPKSSTSLNGARVSPGDTESGRSSSASQREVDEDEVRADEEMAAYVRRQYSKKSSAGMSEDAIRKMFEFPDPTDPLPPLESKDALSLYSRFLSPYEKEEIREYRKVYFVGPNSEKKPAEKDKPTNNFGYDDERGDYLLVPHDHLHYRYEVIDVLGKGSFGQVLQCRDHKTGDMVAIKIIRNKKRFHHQALVEIKVLENLVKWDPNEKHFVIRMVDSFTFRGHLCIVTELLSINLYELVKANSFAGFSTTLIRRFTVQILGSLSLLRHHRVVHCDLKPENILLKHPAKSAIKVIDFGSSCFEHEKVYTYIQSRFYRSPEVILGMNYHMGIDMWSLGCIIAEMYTGYPIFPGENEQEQLACIMEVMGLPDKYLVDRSSRKRLFFDSTGAPRPVVNSKGRRRRPGSKTLAQVLKTDDELFIDFIAKCLIWDPDRRLKPDQAGRHAWILQNRTNTSNPPTIPPPRTRGSSALPTSTSTRFNSTTNLSSISTPLKKQPQPASTSTAPLPRTRTFSTSTVNTTGSTRLGSKASLGLPPSGRYQVKS